MVDFSIRVYYGVLLYAICQWLLLLLKELLMSGLPEVDPDDWQANTVYSGDCYSEEHQVIKVTVLLKYLRNI